MSANLRFLKVLAGGAVGLMVSTAFSAPTLAQVTPEFRRTFTATIQEPVILDVDLARGDLQIVYSRDGQVSITAKVQPNAGVKSNESTFKPPTIEQSGNHFTIRQSSDPAYAGAGVNVVYRIDVPYRTEVTSHVKIGQQTISGIMGPVKAIAERGDIHASYVSNNVQAQVDNGNLDLRVIGGHADTKARRGNISCERVAQGVTAETADGDITLMVIGPSTATVKKGTGRIEVGGARGSLVGATDGGDVHVKAIPHDDWQVSSVSGNIRVELPPATKFELDATTDSGTVLLDRDDIAQPGAEARAFRQKVNGGGKRIAAHSDSGSIVIR